MQPRANWTHMIEAVEEIEPRAKAFQRLVIKRKKLQTDHLHT